MQILGMHVKFSRQIDGGQGTRNKRGYFSAREAAVQPGETEQQAFERAKARVCEDINFLPGHALTPSR